MFRWSKIPEDSLPEIISDVSTGIFYTLIVQNENFMKIKRKYIKASSRYDTPICAYAGKIKAVKPARLSGEISYNHSFFRNVVDNNIPCVMMHKVKNDWAPEVDTVVCFMAGECNDVFLVHPKDLKIWDSNK